MLTKDEQRQTLEEKLANAPEAMRKLHLRSFDRMTFDSDEDFSDFVDELTSDYDAIEKERQDAIAVAGIKAWGEGKVVADAPGEKIVNEKLSVADIKEWAAINNPKN